MNHIARTLPPPHPTTHGLWCVQCACRKRSQSIQSTMRNNKSTQYSQFIWPNNYYAQLAYSPGVDRVIQAGGGLKPFEIQLSPCFDYMRIIALERLV